MNKLPEFLIEMLEKQYGKEYADRIIDGYTKKRPVTLRVNTLKANNIKIERELNNAKIEFEKMAIFNNTYIIKNVREDEIKKLEIYKNGEIYLQSLSSMLPPIILEPKEGEDILDMAAAPGGKTTQIATLTNNNAHITACELNKIRLERLKYNVDKQGATSVYIMNEDSRKINDYFSFDRILLDAPCSGSGTLYLEEQENTNINSNNIENVLDTKGENNSGKFTLKLIEKSTKSQLELLKKALKILKPGHEMVYSTCSILQEENEDVLNEVLKTVKAKIIPIDFSSINELSLLPTKIEGTLCIMPNELFEGFFVAKIVKEE